MAKEVESTRKRDWRQWNYLSLWVILVALTVFQATARSLDLPDFVDRQLTEEETAEVISRNSPLTDYVYLSPRAEFPRENEIERITIHRIGDDLSLQEAGELYSLGDRLVSANYAIDSDGNVGLYVEESNASHTSGSRHNDNRAVNIEVANDRLGSDGHVSDEALSALIELVADICYRNGIEELTFTGDDRGVLTLHSMFRNTTCPGDYLVDKVPFIVSETNEKMSEMRMEAELDAKVREALSK